MTLHRFAQALTTTITLARESPPLLARLHLEMGRLARGTTTPAKLVADLRQAQRQPIKRLKLAAARYIAAKERAARVVPIRIMHRPLYPGRSIDPMTCTMEAGVPVFRFRPGAADGALTHGDWK